MKRFELQPSEYESLSQVHMSCDRPLTEKPIKPPFVNRSFAMCVSGGPGSGKTSLVMSLLKKARKKSDNVYYRVFSDIIWVCPSGSRGSIEGSPLQYIESIYDELSFEVADKIDENKRKFDRDKKHLHSQLLLIDDCGGDLKNHTEMLNRLFMNRRHLNLSIIILTQYVTSLPRSVRAQISMPVMFKPSPQDRDTIHKEYTSGLSKEEWKHLSQFVWRDKHDFLIINRDTDEYYRNLQKVVMHP